MGVHAAVRIMPGVWPVSVRWSAHQKKNRSGPTPPRWPLKIRGGVSMFIFAVDGGGAGQAGSHELSDAYCRAPGVTAGSSDCGRPARPAATYDR